MGRIGQVGNTARWFGGLSLPDLPGLPALPAIIALLFLAGACSSRPPEDPKDYATTIAAERAARELAAKEAEYKARFANPFVAGARGFILYFTAPFDHETIERIATEVRPKLEEAIA